MKLTKENLTIVLILGIMIVMTVFVSIQKHRRNKQLIQDSASEQKYIEDMIKQLAKAEDVIDSHLQYRNTGTADFDSWMFSSAKDIMDMTHVKEDIENIDVLSIPEHYLPIHRESLYLMTVAVDSVNNSTVSYLVEEIPLYSNLEPIKDEISSIKKRYERSNI